VQLANESEESTMASTRYWAILPILLCIFVVACNKQPNGTHSTKKDEAPQVQTNSSLSGSIEIDGSSTVFPITEAVAEEFENEHKDVSITVGVSGTGGGFKRFTSGETAIQDASRPIKDKEDATAKEKGIEFIELPVAFDGLTVVVNPQNDWVDHLTVAELRRIWEPESKVKSWADVRAGWPAEPVKLYGPGTDSGTFDYFTEAINGESKASRSDYTASEDDNVLVLGVSGDKYALGYFGLAYFEENSDKLKAVPVDGGSGPVSPSADTVSNGEYAPLSRPLFIYVSTAALEQLEVAAFVEYFLEKSPELVGLTGYIALPETAYEAVRAHYAARITGSMFMGKETVGLTIEQVLAAEQ
jgi:phosphate transport system substrate-binding protein